MNIDALHYRTGEHVRVHVEDGAIAAIEALGIRELPLEEREGLPIVAPGLVDLQINGYGGYDFNHPALGAEDVKKAVRAVWREGVTGFYPTVITGAPYTILGAMRAIARACEDDEASAATIKGIHLEGPFLSPEDGPRGAHALEHIRPPDTALFDQWQEASGGRISIVTLAPEWEGSAEFIRHCVRQGVTVSIGHTSADAAQIAGAVAAGARLSTHLGNGAHAMLPRHPNYLWAQLAADELWCTLIADGFHLPDEVLKVAMKVKGQRALLVSDAVALAGLPPGSYDTPVGGRVVLTPAGRLHLAGEPGLLAGSAQMLLRHIARLSAAGLACLPDAWDMASVHPAGFMALPAAAGLAAGAPADLALIRRTGPGGGGLALTALCQAGGWVYRRE
ncbi:N-acetylglucosamine-6-phosphate deacetylase [Paenibacillus sp. FSL R7-0333]|uniref:N-acetylglucosamine-6-phosphate deacetylase n=1 Tax=Paenibacillus sp. FSL R7-0333 TaxID=1926587 RepID=UPI00096CD18F|nr:N-acetylglucosamine-6-phosphate deacetylase [Paenibacillus sp. FSL R7-0333]